MRLEVTSNLQQKILWWCYHQSIFCCKFEPQHSCINHSIVWKKQIPRDWWVMWVDDVITYPCHKYLLFSEPLKCYLTNHGNVCKKETSRVLVTHEVHGWYNYLSMLYMPVFLSHQSININDNKWLIYYANTCGKWQHMFGWWFIVMLCVSTVIYPNIPMIEAIVLWTRTWNFNGRMVVYL